MKPKEISRRGLLKGIPLVAVLGVGTLFSGSGETASPAANPSGGAKEVESYLTCWARIDRVKRSDHLNCTNGEVWSCTEIQADCAGYDGSGQEFPLRLYKCFLTDKEGEEEEISRLLSVLQAGAVLVVSGMVKFPEEDEQYTIFLDSVRNEHIPNWIYIYATRSREDDHLW